MTADKLTKGQIATVVSCADLHMSEIGFYPGEFIKIMEVAPFHGPKAVRIGVSTFAVHNEELAMVEVKIEE